VTTDKVLLQKQSEIQCKYTGVTLYTSIMLLVYSKSSKYTTIQYAIHNSMVITKCTKQLCWSWLLAVISTEWRHN